MKKLIRLSIVVFLIVFTFQSSAQVRFGVKAGLNLAKMLDKDSSTTYSDNFKMKPGINFGATTEIPVSESFSIEPGLFFSNKGYKMQDSAASLKFNLSYVDLPINVVYNIDLDYLKVSINAGPYLAIALKARAKSNEKIFDDGHGNKVDKVNLNLGRYKSDEAKQVDYGVSLGVGAEINSICFGVQYSLGLANITTNTENQNIFKNRVIGITVGYKIKSSEQTAGTDKSNKRYSKKKKTKGKLKRY
jgi:hypothetical protein